MVVGLHIQAPVLLKNASVGGDSSTEQTANAVVVEKLLDEHLKQCNSNERPAGATLNFALGCNKKTNKSQTTIPVYQGSWYIFHVVRPPLNMFFSETHWRPQKKKAAIFFLAWVVP